MTLPMSIALDKELTFKTVFRYRHIYPMAIQAVADGKINLKGIVTDEFPLMKRTRLGVLYEQQGGIVKQVIKIHDN